MAVLHEPDVGKGAGCFPPPSVNPGARASGSARSGRQGARGSSLKIEQVFLNLLSNARYALGEADTAGAAPRRITVTGGEETVDGVSMVRLSFHDNGAGIPRDLLDKVANPFFSTKPRGKGTGLGLSISHGIVTDHGGRLLIESEEGVYTRVSVLLPECRAPDAAAAPGAREAPEEPVPIAAGGGT